LFKQNSKGVLLCDVKDHGVFHPDIPLIVSSCIPSAMQSTKNPFSYTFIPSQNAVVFANYGLNGGMIAGNQQELTQLLTNNDSALAKIIAQRLPKGTYTCVNVVSMDYNFSGMASSKPSRVISLSVTRSEVFGSFFHAVFAGLGIISADQFKGFNEDTLKKQLLEQITNVQGQVDEIEKSYKQCTEVNLYLAQDMTGCEIKIFKNNFILGTYKVSEVIKVLGPVIFALIVNKKPQNS
jgi:hypothetical protein